MIKKIRFYKSLLIEIVETLCTICLYLEIEGRRNHNRMAEHMRSHFECLKGFSEEMRGHLKGGMTITEYIKMVDERLRKLPPVTPSRHVDCEGAEYDGNGCLGYSHYGDDFPIKECLHCPKYTLNIQVMKENSDADSN